jgi:hypothetical protein
MIVESMNDQEFVLEVSRDYFDEMREYSIRALTKKGKIKKRHASNYASKKRNNWTIIYRPENGGQCGLYIKRLQPNSWFTWYSLVLTHEGLTLVGFNKHIAERISERFHPDLKPSEALREMLIKTPAIIQSETGDDMYTRVNGGVCIGSVFGKTFSIDVGSQHLQVAVLENKTFISDDLLFDNQKEITDESISYAIQRLGGKYLSDEDIDGNNV